MCNQLVCIPDFQPYSKQYDDKCNVNDRWYDSDELLFELFYREMINAHRPFHASEPRQGGIAQWLSLAFFRILLRQPEFWRKWQYFSYVFQRIWPTRCKHIHEGFERKVVASWLETTWWAGCNCFGPFFSNCAGSAASSARWPTPKQ